MYNELMSTINQITGGGDQSAESSCGPPVGNTDVGQCGCCPSFFFGDRGIVIEITEDPIP